MLYFGADPNAKTTSGLTPMMVRLILLIPICCSNECISDVYMFMRHFFFKFPFSNEIYTPLFKLAITNGRRNTACILKDAGSTIVLPYILRNLFLLSCFSISFLFMWPGLLTRTSQYRLVIALVLFSGG